MALTRMMSVSTVDELKRYNNRDSEIIIVNEQERTGGKPFRWIGRSKEPNGGTILPGEGGAWEMMFDGAVNVQWFGALPNGSDVTIQFQRAVDYAASIGRPVYVPGNPEPLVYRLSQVNLHDNSIVYGDYRRSIIVPANFNVRKIFNVEGAGYLNKAKTFVNLYRLTLVNQLQSGPISVGCTAIHFKYCDEISLSEIVIDGFDVNINIEDTTSFHGSHLRVRGATKNNVRISWTKKVTDNPPHVGSWITFSESTFNGGVLAHANAAEKYSVYIENYASVIFDKCVIAGNAGGGFKFTQTYLTPAVIKDLGYIIINQCDIDSNRGSGIKGEYARNCIISNNWLSTGREEKLNGIDLSNCESFSITNNHCFLNGNDGIKLTNCRYMSLSGNVSGNNAVNNAGVGVNMVDTFNSTLVANILNSRQFGWTGGRQSKGLETAGRSNFNIISANVVQTQNKSLPTVGKDDVKVNNIY